ncbi:transposase [Pseudomonas sp. W5-36]|uniref:transposase n=1 Tax=Pseudomonas sp. W5-36 TaxID=3097455 RepID=UPI0039789AF5
MAGCSPAQHLQETRKTQRVVQSNTQDRENQSSGSLQVEHPFRVIKRQFGYVNVRYRGLAKNTAQVLTLFALSNLCMKRKQLLLVVAEMCL